MGRLRLRRAHLREEAVADRCDLPLGAVLPPTRESCDERHLEVRLLLRQPQGQFRRARVVRAEGEQDDEGEDRRDEGQAAERNVLRVRRSAVRPEGEAPRQEGAAPLGHGSLRDELARQKRDV